jgi:hypothetical protein
LRYAGTQSLLIFSPPTIEGFGIRGDAQELFRKVGVKLNRLGFSPQGRFRGDGWYSMGSAQLPADGFSSFAVQSAAFNLDAALILASGPVHWPMARRDVKSLGRDRFTPLLAISAVLLLALYLWVRRRYRRCTRGGPVAPGCSRTREAGGGIGWAFWTIGSAGFYVAWIFNGAGQEDALFSLGSLCLAFALSGFGRLAEQWLPAWLVRTSEDRDGCSPALRKNAGMATVLLAASAAAAMAGFSQIAEALCVVLYCLALVTVVSVLVRRPADRKAM